MAKLIYENPDYEQEVSIKFNKDIDIYEFLEVWEKICLAVGYHPNSVIKSIIQRAEEKDTIKELNNDK